MLSHLKAPIRTISSILTPGGAGEREGMVSVKLLKILKCRAAKNNSSTYHSIINSRFKQSSPQAIAPFERSSLGSTGHSHCILLISRWDLLFFLGKKIDTNAETHRFLSRCCFDLAGWCFTSQSGRDSPQLGQSRGAFFWIWSAPSI